MLTMKGMSVSQAALGENVRVEILRSTRVAGIGAVAKGDVHEVTQKDARVLIAQGQAKPAAEKQTRKSK